jgi:putative chitinase
MTLAQLQNTAVSSAAYAEKFLPYLTETCVKYDILSPARQLCFLAQVSHESGGLFYTEELASGAAYEGRKDLGNIHPGDGPKYRGRGLIQITGRNNYGLLGSALGVDFVNNPSLLSAQNINACSPDQLKYAALSAGWFWNRENLNALADHINLFSAIDEGQNLEYFKEITRKINGGYNGLPDRLHRYKAGLNQFLAALPSNNSAA